MTLLNTLRNKLIGQDEVLSEIAELFDCALAGYRYTGEPIASVLLLGPTGVGKTETVLIACEKLFGDPLEHMARFDMSEYMTAEALPNFLMHMGEKYIQTGGAGMILLDELEKAEPKIIDLLLQILSAARITLMGGTVLDLSQYIVCATSNIGARLLMDTKDDRYEAIRDLTVAAALQELRPEMLPRFNLLATFKKLGDDSTKAITQIHVNECLRIMRKLGHLVEVSEGALEHIRREGYSEGFGARPIRTAAMRIIGGAVLKKQASTTDRIVGTLEYKPSKEWVGIP